MKEWMWRFEGGPLHGQTVVVNTEEPPSNVIAFHTKIAGWTPLEATEHNRQVVAEYERDVEQMPGEHVEPHRRYVKLQQSRLSEAAVAHPNVGRGAVYVLEDDPRALAA